MRKKAIVAIALLVAISVAVAMGGWLQARNHERALGECVGGAMMPDNGSTSDRVERIAMIEGIRRDVETGQQEPAQVDPSAWPFRCAPLAKQFRESRANRVFSGRFIGRAKELEEALTEGYLPSDLDWALQWAGAAANPNDTDRDLARLEPILTEKTARIEGTGETPPFDETGRLMWRGQRATIKLESQECTLQGGEAGELSSVVCDDKPSTNESGYHRDGFLRIGTQASFESRWGFALTTRDGTRHDVRLPEGSSQARFCPYAGGAVGVYALGLYEQNLFRGNPPLKGLWLVWTDGATLSQPISVASEEKLPLGSQLPTLSAVGLSCSLGLARITWVSTTFDERYAGPLYTLHRALCSRNGCDRSTEELHGLSTAGIFSGMNRRSVPDSYEPPFLIDLGDRAWLLWFNGRALEGRSAPFGELASAQTIHLAATYDVRAGEKPIPGALALSYQAGASYVAENGAAVIALVNRKETYLVRLRGDGNATFLGP